MTYINIVVLIMTNFNHQHDEIWFCNFQDLKFEIRTYVKVCRSWSAIEMDLVAVVAMKSMMILEYKNKINIIFNSDSELIQLIE